MSSQDSWEKSKEIDDIVPDLRKLTQEIKQAQIKEGHLMALIQIKENSESTGNSLGGGLEGWAGLKKVEGRTRRVHGEEI